MASGLPSGPLGSFYTGSMAPPLRLPDGSFIPAPSGPLPSYGVSDFYRGMIAPTTQPPTRPFAAPPPIPSATGSTVASKDASQLPAMAYSDVPTWAPWASLPAVQAINQVAPIAPPNLTWQPAAPGPFHGVDPWAGLRLGRPPARRAGLTTGSAPPRMLPQASAAAPPPPFNPTVDTTGRNPSDGGWGINAHGGIVAF